MANEARSTDSARSSGLLADTHAVVTGASSGIGRAIALRFADEGADLTITFRRSEGGAEEVAAAVRARGRRCDVVRADVAREEDVARLVDTAFARRSAPRVWVNNAGADILTGAGARLSDVEKLDLLLTVDLRGTVLCSWRAAERMREAGGGVILNMSWDHALTGMEGRNPEMFAAAKGGVLAFSRSLARSVAPEVRVNVLAPGWIRTAFAESLDERDRERVARATPMGRWGTPEDVADAAAFLASDRAGFVTGHAMLISGGIVM